MKEIVTLPVEKRDGTGTKASRRLRAGGRVPCVVYGHKQEPAAVMVDHGALDAAVRQHTRMLELDLSGTKELVLLQGVQHDTFGVEIIHADFLRVAMDELIRIRVPVELRGRARGEQHGGVVEQLLTEVEVECLPGDIPESIPFIVTELDIGQSVQASQLAAPQGVKIVTEPAHLVLTVAAPKKKEEEVAVAAAEPAAAEPEVIARGKAEEEEEGLEAEKGKEKK